MILSIEGLTETRRAAVTRDIANQLSSLGIRGAPPEGANQEGARGDTGVWTEIILSIVSGGSLVALLNCLRSYISREKSLKIIIRVKDGKQVTIDAKNIDSGTLQASMNSLIDGID